MQVRIVAIRDINIAGVQIPAGGVFCTAEFDNVLLAEFFAARFNWSWFRVELGSVDLVVGTEPVSDLPEVAALLAEQDAPTAQATLANLAALGVSSIADLAKANSQALRRIVGPRAGALTRSAKRKVIALRHAALIHGEKTISEPLLAEEVDLFDLLARSNPEDLASLGIGPKKANEIIEAAQALIAERAEAEAKAKADAEANPS